MSTNTLTQSDIAESPSSPGDPVSTIRSFNRFWTKKIGALGGSHLLTSYSLTEARVLFEMAQRPLTEVADLRRELELDAGYLSRILTRFKTEKLATLESSEVDARRQLARLTHKGKDVFAALDKKAIEAVGAMLSSLLEEDKRRLVAGLTTARQVLEGSPKPVSYLLRGLAPGDLGWVVRRHGTVYAEEYGYDERFEALVAKIMSEYVEHRDPERESAWFAEMDGEPVGSIFCVKKTATVAQLRCLIVDRKARGLGIGQRLVDECIKFAKKSGYKRMVLWTHGSLVSARRIYEAAGFALDKEEKNHSFGRDVVDQNWSRTL